MYRRPEFSIATEYFPRSEDEGYLLNRVVKSLEQEYVDSIGSLWVPHNLLHDHTLMTDIVGLARGDAIRDHNRVINMSAAQYELPVPTNEHHDGSGDTIVHDDEGGLFELIIDTSSGGGAKDILADIEKTLDRFRAQRTTFTLSPSAGIEGIHVILDAFKNEPGVSFLLTGVYPETTPKGTLLMHGEDEEIRTMRLSKLSAEEFDNIGLVGAAHLARCTLHGQRYLAMGVTWDGRDYWSPVNTNKYEALRDKLAQIPEPPNEHHKVGETLFDEHTSHVNWQRQSAIRRLGVNPDDLQLPPARFVLKRSSKPEDTLEGNTQTELLLGRTLLRRSGRPLHPSRTSDGSPVDVVAYVANKIRRFHKKVVAIPLPD